MTASSVQECEGPVTDVLIVDDEVLIRTGLRRSNRGAGGSSGTEGGSSETESRRFVKDRGIGGLIRAGAGDRRGT
jgi:hypothetical protein